MISVIETFRPLMGRGMRRTQATKSRHDADATPQATQSKIKSGRPGLRRVAKEKPQNGPAASHLQAPPTKVTSPRRRG